MRSYGQYCSIAKALDVIGDRWTMLIIRELLIRGPCRYTDLKNGLPGIATNLLSSRIRELESAGLIEREDAPPPIATTLFRLTEAGAQLQPALDAIGGGGVGYMAEPAEGDEFRGHWLAFPASFFLHDRDPGGPPVSIELRTASSPVVIEVSGGSARTRLGTAAAPDLVLQGEPQVILALFSGYLTTADAADLGLGPAATPACCSASCRNPRPRLSGCRDRGPVAIRLAGRGPRPRNARRWRTARSSRHASNAVQNERFGAAHAAMPVGAAVVQIGGSMRGRPRHGSATLRHRWHRPALRQGRDPRSACGCIADLGGSYRDRMASTSGWARR